MIRSDKHVAVVGVDLAKRVFAVHGVDQSGVVVLKKLVC